MGNFKGPQNGVNHFASGKAQKMNWYVVKIQVQSQKIERNKRDPNPHANS